MKEYVAIVKLLDEVFGKSRNHNEYTGQISYDCPVCSYEIKGLDHGDGKGNLEINYIDGVANCWACSDTHETHGSVETMIRKFGTLNQLKKYRIIKPDYGETERVEKHYDLVKLPPEFIPLSSVSDGFKLTHYYKRAMNYLRGRNITDEMVQKFNIGFCREGKYSNRIIIPSYNKKKNLNYFIARSYIDKPLLKYLNPKAEKEIIIFNEHLIDWNKPIYIVEGAFDSIFIPNSIPLLGKKMSDELFSLIYKKATSEIIVVLDPDANDNAELIYNQLNGGKLYGRVWIIKLSGTKDIAELCGDLHEYEKEKLR